MGLLRLVVCVIATMSVGVTAGKKSGSSKIIITTIPGQQSGPIPIPFPVGIPVPHPVPHPIFVPVDRTFSQPVGQLDHLLGPALFNPLPGTPLFYI